jgi:hypothetical protein
MLILLTVCDDLSIFWMNFFILLVAQSLLFRAEVSDLEKAACFSGAEV